MILTGESQNTLRRNPSYCHYVQQIFNLSRYENTRHYVRAVCSFDTDIRMYLGFQILTPIVTGVYSSGLWDVTP